MELVADPDVFSRFPGLRVVVVAAAGVDNQSARELVSAQWRDAWIGATQAAVYGNAQSHPRIRPWRDRFQAMGVSGKEFPSSIEALLRRALKGGEPFQINPLVDWYNAISLRHMVPVGGFDLDQTGGPIELRLTRAGDQFVTLDATAPVAVPPGEVAYANGHTILTRHFVWRQARTGLIGAATRNVVLVSEVLGEAGAEVASAVLADLRDGLRHNFGVASQGWLLDVHHSLARSLGERA
jgi:DNA/RNA-binding domain of Phe-tRNA-synthetase-like protein